MTMHFFAPPASAPDLSLFLPKSLRREVAG